MAENSKIEWTSATFNPWEGCTKVSPGCAHCYAETRSNRLKTSKWGPSGTRVVRSESYWREPVKWNKAAAACICFRRDDLGERHLPSCPQLDRPRVFCASLADVFEDWRGPMTLSNGITATTQVPGFAERPMLMSDARVRLLKLICDTPNLDWLLLTKRPQNIQPMLRDAWMQLDSARDPDPRNSRPFVIPRNIWLGTSVENQTAADERIPHLLRTPAAVRFLSCEPLLGQVNLTNALDTVDEPGDSPEVRSRGIHWVIVGGESGHGARPFDLKWAYDIVKQCHAAAVPAFVKQLGGNPVEAWPGELIAPGHGYEPPEVVKLGLRNRKGGDMAEWPADLRVREFPTVPRRTTA